MSQADEDDAVLDAAAESELLAMLEAALRPNELDPAVNERLIEMALEDPLAPASDEELAESARLRDALEAGAPHEAQATLAALKAAFGDVPADASAEAAVQRAVTAALPRRSNVVYAAFGAAGAVLAAAAALLLVVGNLTRDAAPAASALVKPHSTAPLFSDRFETDATTARMDLIANERSRDLRDNRYASWGVR